MTTWQKSGRGRAGKGFYTNHDRGLKHWNLPKTSNDDHRGAACTKAKEKTRLVVRRSRSYHPVAVLMVLLTVTRDTGRQSGLTAGDLEQQKYDAQQQINDRNKAAQIRNGSLLLRKEDADTQAQLDSLMGQLQKTLEPTFRFRWQMIVRSRSRRRPLPRYSRTATGGPAPAYEPSQPGSPSQPAQTTAEAGDQPMFVYSRTFGGAKFVDAPKSPPDPSVQPVLK